MWSYIIISINNFIYQLTDLLNSIILVLYLAISGKKESKVYSEKWSIEKYLIFLFNIKASEIVVFCNCSDESR